MSTIRLRLPVLRAERRLSQRKLAERAGLRPDTVSSLERGATAGIQFETLARICDALNCEPGDLFELDRDDHVVPVLGGPDEDDIIRSRLAESGPLVDGPTFIAALQQMAAKGSQPR
jgi:putative transcriptional regulator